MSKGNTVRIKFDFELSTCSEETDFKVRKETYLTKYHRHTVRANPCKAHSDTRQSPDNYVQHHRSGFQVFCNPRHPKQLSFFFPDSAQFYTT